MASNSLAVIQAGNNPVDFSTKMNLAYASIVGCSPDQGAGVALAGYCEGLNPLEFKRRYHWIPNKGPSMRADAMLAEFRLNHGGKYKLIESSTKACKITFTDKDGNEYPREMTRMDLMLSRNPWKKDPGWAKMVDIVKDRISKGEDEDTIFAAVSFGFGDNYGTPMDWENMLMARLISQSLRKICPELVAGIYTPEEMEDAEIVPTTPTAPVAKPSVETLLQQAAASPAPAAVSSPVSVSAGDDDTAGAPFEGDVSEAEFEVKDEGGAAPAGKVTRILNLAETLWPAESDRVAALNTILQKRGVTAVSMLSDEQAAEVIDKLEAASKNR